MNERYERAGRILYWLVPPVWCLALYWQGLFTWFQADDFAWLNLQVHSWNDLWKALFTPQAQGTVRVWSERLFFIVFKDLFGIHAAPFRIWVFLTQIANLLLIAQITRRLTGSRFAALTASILWISNSALTVVMGWNSAYNEALCALFVLAAFLALLRYIDTSDPRFNRLQWAFYLLGFGTLELNTVYPLLAASYTALCAKQRLRKTLLLFAPAVVFTAIHFVLIPKPSGGPYRLHLDGAVFETLVTYWTWAVASRQMAILGGAGSRLEPVVVALFTITLLGFAIWRTLRRDFLPVFFLAWFAIFLLPVLPLRDRSEEHTS